MNKKYIITKFYLEGENLSDKFVVLELTNKLRTSLITYSDMIRKCSEIELITIKNKESYFLDINNCENIDLFNTLNNYCKELFNANDSSMYLVINKNDIINHSSLNELFPDEDNVLCISEESFGIANNNYCISFELNNLNIISE